MIRRFRPSDGVRTGLAALAGLPALAALWACTGCNSIMNSWLDPTIPGNFTETGTTSIRSMLTVEDSPAAIPGATDPTRDDLKPYPFEYDLGPGDVVAVEIDELRQVGEPFQSQFQISPSGELAIPDVGRFACSGMSPAEMEEEIKRRLRESELLTDPKVLVLPISVNSARFNIFGIGVSAAANAALRAAPVPITRPDLNLLDAINLVGGLNEFVTEVYVFRKEPAGSAGAAAPGGPPGPGDMAGPGGMSPSRAAPSGAADAEEEPFGAAPTMGSPPDGGGDRESTEARHEARAEDELLAAASLESEPSRGETAHDAAAGEPQERMDEPPPPSKADTLYIFEGGRFVPNPARQESPEGEGAAQPVERMPFFEAVQSTVDWSRIAGESQYRIMRIPAEALRTGDPAYLVIIRPGDVIRIVSGEIGVYYVMGQVNRVGPFTFNSEQVTLKSAIASAGGLGALAWPSRCTIYRRHGSREQMVQVDLDAIFAGKLDDIEIRRGDIINVGTSPFAPWLLRLRALTLPNPTSTVGYSFTYSRNFADIDSFAVQPNPATRPKKFEQLFP